MRGEDGADAPVAVVVEVLVRSGGVGEAESAGGEDEFFSVTSTLDSKDERPANPVLFFSGAVITLL